MKKMSMLRLVFLPVMVVCQALAMAGSGFAQGISNTTPVVSIRAADTNASESGDTGLFVIKREGPTNTSLSVFFLVGGSATPGVDYTNLTSPVVIPAGADHAPLVVNPIDDVLREGRESVVVQLVPSPTMGPIEPYRLGYPSNAIVWIEDNEPPPPEPPVVTICATDPNASEPGLLTVIDPGVFTVRRDRGTNGSLLVHYAVAGTASNGVDYIRLTNTVVIPAGSWTANIVVFPLDDVLPEGTETVVARLLIPADCVLDVFPLPASCYRVGSPSEAVVYIADNDEPPPPLPVVNIVAVDPEASEIPPVPPGMEMPQRIDPAVFAVRRDGDTNTVLEVLYRIGGTASNGVDYVRLSGVARIPAGAKAAPIEVIPIDDLLDEGTETVVFTM